MEHGCDVLNKRGFARPYVLSEHTLVVPVQLLHQPVPLALVVVSGTIAACCYGCGTSVTIAMFAPLHACCYGSGIII